MEDIERIVEDMRRAAVDLRSIARADASLRYAKQLLSAVQELDGIVYGLEREVIDNFARQDQNAREPDRARGKR